MKTRMLSLKASLLVLLILFYTTIGGFSTPAYADPLTDAQIVNILNAAEAAAQAERDRGFIDVVLAQRAAAAARAAAQAAAAAEAEAAAAAAQAAAIDATSAEATTAAEAAAQALSDYVAAQRAAEAAAAARAAAQAAAAAEAEAAAAAQAAAGGGTAATSAATVAATVAAYAVIVLEVVYLGYLCAAYLYYSHQQSMCNQQFCALGGTVEEIARLEESANEGYASEGYTGVITSNEYCYFACQDCTSSNPLNWFGCYLNPLILQCMCW